MRPRSTSEIRRQFLDFFVERAHTEVPSSALVPAHDPTLLFTNAGMVQFKDVFTGKERRNYVRAVSSQKCLRAGGKHNDLEAVGHTPRHHTFFEMLGNFSFGDYFKRDAIAFAWGLVRDVFEIPADRLCVTVFAGGDGIPADDEAAALWQDVGVAPERIFRCGKSDNYWQMGDTGPQGPCTEIHYFVPDDMSGALVRERVERSEGWLEIWNLVFMQFVKETVDAPLAKLPRPCVDTGAGLERLAMVLQGKTSNYDTDVFAGLLQKIARDVGKPYASAPPEDAVSMRVIADHARATSFLLADGVMPDRDGRGYVLRRIMRRAIRHGRRLGFDDLFFHRACAAVVEEMQDAYPDLVRASSLIDEVARREEAAFRRTLDRGLKLLDDAMRTHASAEAMSESTSESTPPSTGGPSPGLRVLSPAFVAELYDTYGFPIDLTHVVARERGFVVDEDAAGEEVRRRQAKSSAAELSKVESIDRVWFALRDSLGTTAFMGYETTANTGTIRAIVRGTERVDSAKDGEEVDIILDRTVFYGESGGQVGDTGVIEGPRGRAEVLDTLRPIPEVFVHRAKVVGELRASDTVKMRVDDEKRSRTERNHSATHLLHLALKEVLGAHVQQKGSLVGPDRLRFDFSHFEALAPDKIREIERRVNGLVVADAPTATEVVGIDRARSAGAMMLFGEKYGEEVRMVRIGGDSLELCGGTHVGRSGEIGLFKIMSDASIASGVRRIEAATGRRALEFVQSQEQVLREVSELVKANPDQVRDRVERVLRRNKELERELEQAEAKAALGGGPSRPDIETIGGISVLFHRADGTPKKALRPLADRLRDQLGSGVVILTACEEGKVALLVAATKDMTGRVDAGALVKAASSAMEGSGGGRPDFAQGGGQESKLEAGLAAIRQSLGGSTTTGVE